MRTDKCVEQSPSRWQVRTEECGRGMNIELLTRVQREQPERPCRIGVELPERPGEHRPDRGVFVLAGGQQVEPTSLVAEFVDQLGECRARAGGRELAGDAQRERQPDAAFGQCSRLRGRSVDACA
jgi:hypothetical protein